MQVYRQPVARKSSGMTIHRLDHLVLTVKDVQKTVNFYKSVMGMEEVTFKVGFIHSYNRATTRLLHNAHCNSLIHYTVFCFYIYMYHSHILHLYSQGRKKSPRLWSSENKSAWSREGIRAKSWTTNFWFCWPVLYHRGK